MSTIREGSRIRLLEMPDDPDPIPAGSEGVVTYAHLEGTYQWVHVDWDNGRSLSLIPGTDRWEVIG